MALATRGPRLVVWAVLAGTVGCGFSSEATDRSTQLFRARYAQGSFKAIYATASDELKRASTAADFLEYMEAVRRKLGDVEVARASGRSAFATPVATRVIQVFDTRFQRGTARETFTWEVRFGQPFLAGYHIESRELVIR
jgi:hypothetical protein